MYTVERWKERIWTLPLNPNINGLLHLYGTKAYNPYEFLRAPFGQKGSGPAFVRVLQLVLQPIREFADSYVDDISVFSDQWRSHLSQLEKFLQVIKDSGFTLNLEKTCLAQNQVRFLGHIIGSGQRKIDPDKVRVVQEMKRPENKKKIRQVFGFFSYFRD